MRRAFLIAGVMTAFAVAVLAASANFAGSWALDKSKSQGLSPRMQGADSVTWTITQDDKTISIDQKFRSHLDGEFFMARSACGQRAAQPTLYFYSSDVVHVGHHFPANDGRNLGGLSR